ncbi:unnamed protein product [Kuraishia capsulata CBS 1993]|uniref:Uncharacterized protein n=1 Tax=Kuraishia capsulata CBS 1993 TaxID=1382522 RepID=W6MIA1_9ASCO|nr:uncharacterized protein KUCA_T00001837001 [Kuraishia capsulata CBS 1993]CDK25866.1 unnamed protein product [Kuraishia capsulata CBS 1993]
MKMLRTVSEYYQIKCRQLTDDLLDKKNWQPKTVIVLSHLMPAYEDLLHLTKPTRRNHPTIRESHSFPSSLILRSFVSRIYQHRVISYLSPCSSHSPIKLRTSDALLFVGPPPNHHFQHAL